MNRKSAPSPSCLGLVEVSTVAGAMSLMQGMRDSGQDPDKFDWIIGELADAADPVQTAPAVVRLAAERIAALELKRIFASLAV